MMKNFEVVLFIIVDRSIDTNWVIGARGNLWCQLTMKGTSFMGQGVTSQGPRSYYVNVTSK